MGIGLEGDEFAALLERASVFHGHMCTGLYIGVRMALFAGSMLNADWNDESFVVEVETDRCPADGILVATGLSVGRKRFRVLDYGKCAASFYDTHNDTGVRLRFRNEIYSSPSSNVAKRFATVPDSTLFEATQVTKRFSDSDLPGVITREVVCCRCGETVQDGREVYFAGNAYCIPCRDLLSRGMTSDDCH